MKKTLLILTLVPAALFAGSEANPGGPMPSQVTVIGGKDGSGKAQPFKTSSNGAVQTTTGTVTADNILSLTTAATGTNWTAFGSQAATSVLVVNTTGTDLSARIGGAGNTVPIPNNTALKLSVAANANELSLRRADTSNTQVVVSAVGSQ